MRECTVDGKRAYFHQWNTYQSVIEASPFIGGAPAGQIEYTVGLVEYEDGSVAEVAPQKIKFSDRPDVKVAARKCPARHKVQNQQVNAIV